MIIPRSILLALALCVLPACSGLTVHSSPTNLPVPPELDNRSLWEDPSILQYKLDGLCGYILEKSAPDQHWHRKIQILPTTFSTVPELIPDGALYSSIVDNKISGSASTSIPLLSAAASMKNNQRMDLTITDTALLYIKDKTIPWTELKAYTDSHPLQAGCSRVWVQAVMLTQLRMGIATETQDDASVSGSVFGADGHVYNQTTTAQRQAYLTMLLVDPENASRVLANGVTGSSSDRSIYLVVRIPKGGLEL